MKTWLPLNPVTPVRLLNKTLLLLLASLLLTGTSFADTARKVDSRSIEAGKATSVKVEFTMQPGNLQMRGGAAHLIDARFDYHPPAWKPVIRYDVSGTRGHLVVRQPSLQSVAHGRNAWDVQLSDRMPTDLLLATGPGNATLALRSLKLNTMTAIAGPGNMSIDAGSPSLRRISVSIGPGNLTVNLAAAWKHDLTANINVGIGNTTLRLPTKVGAQVTVRGTGRVSAPGFTKQHGAYVNASFHRSKVTVRASINAGVGNVILKGEG